MCIVSTNNIVIWYSQTNAISRISSATDGLPMEGHTDADGCRLSTMMMMTMIMYYVLPITVAPQRAYARDAHAHTFTKMNSVACGAHKD